MVDDPKVLEFMQEYEVDEETAERAIELRDELDIDDEDALALVEEE